MRFRTKTIIGIAVIEMALLGVLVGSVLSILRESNESELVRRVQLGGTILAASAKDAVISEDLATLDSLVEEAMHTGQIDFIKIIDANGVILTERGDKNVLLRPFHQESHLDQVSDGIFHWSSPVIVSGIKYGEVRLGVSTQPLSILLKSAQRWAAGIAGLEMLLVAIFSWLLGSYLVRQLEELRDASNSFAAGDFNRRVGVKGDDELAHTAIAFNQMAQQISESHALLKHENQERLKAEQLAAFEKSQAYDRSEQLSTIFALSPDGFISFNAEHRVVYVSSAFSKLTGLKAEEIVGLDEVAFINRLSLICIGDTRFLDIKKLGRLSDSNDSYLPRQQIVIRGTEKRILEVGLRMANTTSISQILFFKDITRETEVDRMKAEFLSTAAHELRTPMASIYGFTAILKSMELSEPERREFLDIIFTQSELMICIIDELLDLARIDEGRDKDFVMVTMNICELIREVVANLKVPGNNRSPELINTIEGAWVVADRLKMMQVLNNIISNSYKYSPNGGLVSIELKLHSSEDSVSQESKPTRIGIRIADNGIGMTKEQLARVFERFYRANTSSQIPGVGLGMSIVKEIVEVHGGQVTVESTYGVGTAVTIWLNCSNETDFDRPVTLSG